MLHGKNDLLLLKTLFYNYICFFSAQAKPGFMGSSALRLAAWQVQDWRLPVLERREGRKAKGGGSALASLLPSHAC